MAPTIWKEGEEGGPHHPVWFSAVTVTMASFLYLDPGISSSFLPVHCMNLGITNT